MLARRASFEHPTAGTIELPLLVPAFSSKGFQLHHKGNGKHRKPYSEISYQLEEFGKHPQKAVLLSAYDIHFSYFQAPQLSPNAPEAYLKNVGVAFMDSGGYELAPDFDSTEPRRFPHEPCEFTLKDYHAVLDRLARKAPAPLIISNYDHRGKPAALEQQVREARQTFGRYRDFASDFIIKPWKGKYVDPSEMSDSEVANLRGFDVLGVTEKELGRDLLGRLKNVALFRQKLDAQGLKTPIHVWGGLEPVATPLFFFAGAQIVDGVSWLRYAYRSGLAIVRDSYCVVSDIGLGATSPMNHVYASLNNLVTLDKLTIALQQWVDLDGKDFTMFPLEVRKQLADAYNVMKAKIPALNVQATNGKRRRRTEEA